MKISLGFNSDESAWDANVKIDGKKAAMVDDFREKTEL